LGSSGELTVIAQGSDVEVQETDSTVAEVEPGPTWREALRDCVRTSDHRLSDEDIFTILNGEDDDAAVALLCDTKGVTLPMYCVLKLKYRQLGLEQLRKARRREERRRYTAIGAVALVATLFIAGIGVALVGAVTSTVKGMTAVPSAAEAEPERSHSPASPPVQTRVVTLESARAKPRVSADAVAPITETGYRIQVTAAETDQEGRALVAQLASKGYPTYMTRATVGNRDVFRVRVGPFDTLPMAEEVATQLRSAGYEGAWIAR
jgi:hypothetical protein